MLLKNMVLIIVIVGTTPDSEIEISIDYDTNQKKVTLDYGTLR